MSDEMKQLIQSVQGDLSLFKEQVSAEFKRTDERLRAVMIEQARTRGSIDKMVTRDEFHAGINSILNRFDAFTGKWDDNRYHLAKQGEMLIDHEKRIAQIEAKPA